jgi:hypothetical protein
MHHLRKRINAQRLRLSTCKAGTLRAELRRHMLMIIKVVTQIPEDYVCHAHSERRNRTALEERIIFAPRVRGDWAAPAGIPVGT